MTQNPIVIAGLKWPPEMWPSEVTMIPMARPYASAMPSNPDASLAVAAEKLIGANRSDAKEDQRKRTDKFSDKFLRLVVHGSASEQTDCANSGCYVGN